MYSRENAMPQSTVLSYHVALSSGSQYTEGRVFVDSSRVSGRVRLNHLTSPSHLEICLLLLTTSLHLFFGSHPLLKDFTLPYLKLVFSYLSVHLLTTNSWAPASARLEWA